MTAKTKRTYTDEQKARYQERHAKYRAANRDKMNTYSREYWRQMDGQRKLFVTAKARAVKKGVPFEIDMDDVIIPDVCPVLGIPFHSDGTKNCDNAMSLDRIDPSKGYVKGNVAVISFRANRIKNDGSAAEHQAIANWMQG